MADLNLFRYAHVKSFLSRCLSAKGIGFLLLLSAMVTCRAGNLEAAQRLPADLTELSLEELMNIEITSVSKKPQKLSNAAAAIFVITQEAIRRSGVTSIPEALRMVPGLQVARMDANKWAITSRGFSGRLANKLLVLIDGRSVYTPLYSGVFWEAQDVLLEDVDRIEVIRGPGATLWGANAVNGVINIMTKQAKETQGGLAVTGTGTEERGFGSVRYGAKLADDTYYRAYAKYFNRDSGVDASGEDMADDWRVVSGGFRIGWKASDNNSLTLQGDIYDGQVGGTYNLASLLAPFYQTFDDDTDISGANILARWSHDFSQSSDMVLQLYYDRTKHNEALVREDRSTFDTDFQHRFALGSQQEIMWGLGYRLTYDDIDNTFSTSFEPHSRDDHLFSAFVQDNITLVKNRLGLILGSKFEHNDYTGLEIQPNGRLLWTPDERYSVWASVSRAVRTPSRIEDDGRFNSQVIPPGIPDNPTPMPALVALVGDRDFGSEELIAYELGYRVQATDRLYVDIAAFYNVYDNLRTFEPGTPFLEISPAPMHLVQPLVADNEMDGETYGVEVMADFRASDWCRLQAAYTYLQMHLRPDSEGSEGLSPHHQLSLRSSMDLPKELELDMWVRYVDDLPGQNVGSYVTLNLHLGWKPHKNLELSIVGQNLLDNRHPEFMPEGEVTLPSEVEPSVYGKVIWRF